jgi:hypothetical protein
MKISSAMAAAAVLACAAPTAAGAVTPIGARIQLTTNGIFPQIMGAPFELSDAADWRPATQPEPYSASIKVINGVGTNGGNVVRPTANGQMTVGAASGSVDFGMRFLVNSGLPVGAGIYGGPGGNTTVFSYSFVADKDGQLTVNGATDATNTDPNFLPFGGWAVSLNGAKIGGFSTDYSSGSPVLDQTGAFTAGLTAGQTYDLTFDVYALWGSPNAHFDSTLTSSFDYAIRENAAPAPGVPEPSAWVMMIAGLGLAGAMLRRADLATAPCAVGRASCASPRPSRPSPRRGSA